MRKKICLLLLMDALKIGKNKNFGHFNIFTANLKILSLKLDKMMMAIN